MALNRERGGAIIFLFIAVALFGAISYAFLQGTRGSTALITGEADKAATYKSQDCSNAINMATKRLAARGCSAGQISSDTSGGVGSGPSDGSCAIYHPNGGGVRDCSLIAGLPDPCAGGPPTPGTLCGDGTYYIGLSPDGNAKMYAAAADEPGQAWGSFGTLRGATSTTTGESNTATLAAFGNSPTTGHPSAYGCYNKDAHGHDDWYLPAIAELDLFKTSETTALAGLDPSALIWSSTEQTAGNSRALQITHTTDWQSRGKNAVYVTRCVRKE